MSDAPNIDRGTERRTTPATDRFQFCWTHRKSLVVASCLATTVIAIAAWRATSAHRPAKSPAIAQAPAGSSALVKPTAPTVSSPPAVPATITQELSELKSAYERLTLRAQDTHQRLDRNESDVAQLKQQFEKQQVELSHASKRAKNAPLRTRTAQATVRVQRSPASPKILGVDTWNGQPSVSVLDGTEVRFFSEGDVVADALVKRADPASQRVELVTNSGAAITTTPVSGEAR